MLELKTVESPAMRLELSGSQKEARLRFRHFVQVVNALAAHHDFELMHVEKLFFEVCVQHVPVVHEERRLSLQEIGPAPGLIGEIGEGHAQEDENRGQNHSACDGIVPAVHRVLNGVAD